MSAIGDGPLRRVAGLGLAGLLWMACDGAHGDGTTGGTGGGAGSSMSSGGGGSASSGGGGEAVDAGGSGGTGAGYVPDPIPDIPEDPPASCGTEKAGYFQFLDNECGEKIWPTNQDRDRPCPVVDDSASVMLKDGTTVTYVPSGGAPSVDTTALAAIVPVELDVLVILIRRVGGVPHYRYLSNGTHDVAYQPWSTTKVFAAANAAATLRIESSYKVGLTASVDGIPLGDLVTSTCNYDGDPYSSNGLGRYFHDIGGREKANDLIHDAWLGRPTDETFGGNYGEAAPPLGFTFEEASGDVWTTTPKPTPSPAIPNHLSAFTEAEFLKRLVLHREEADQRLPGIQWADVRTLLFGAADSAKYGLWGGMTADTAIYLQTGHDIGYIEQRSHGQWTIFSKLGFGTAGQFLNVGYACFPVLDPNDAPVPGWGREMLIAAHLPTGGATWKERDRILAKAYRAIITRVIDGRL